MAGKGGVVADPDCDLCELLGHRACDRCGTRDPGRHPGSGRLPLLPVGTSHGREWVRSARRASADSGGTGRARGSSTWRSVRLRRSKGQQVMARPVEAGARGVGTEWNRGPAPRCVLRRRPHGKPGFRAETRRSRVSTENKAVTITGSGSGEASFLPRTDSGAFHRWMVTRGSSRLGHNGNQPSTRSENAPQTPLEAAT
jgi:hypothetical protein